MRLCLMPTSQPEAPRPITLSTNTILGNKFYNRGDPLPVERVEDLPEQLRPLVVTGEPEADQEPGEVHGSYDLNTVYRVTDDDRLGRRLQRQAAKLEAAAEEQEWIEEEADAPLPPEVAEALQDTHAADVARQAAQAGAVARAADDIADAVAAAAEPPTLYVKRGGRHYAPALKARLKPGEEVFIKDPADGPFQFIGTTDSRADLPELPIIMP